MTSREMRVIRRMKIKKSVAHALRFVHNYNNYMHAVTVCFARRAIFGAIRQFEWPEPLGKDEWIRIYIS